MHLRHDHRVGRWRTRDAVKARPRFLNEAVAGILVLLLLPLLGIAPAHAQAGQISEFKVQGFIDNARMALGSDGDLYFGAGTSTAGIIGRVTPTGQVTEFTDPNTTENNVFLTVAGPDHNIWFGDGGIPNTQGELGRLTPAGQITMFTIPAFNGSRVVIVDMAAGSDGNLWFTANAFFGRTQTGSLVGRVNPATGAITEIPTPTTSASPGPITTGSDGNLWFPETNVPAIARVTTH